MSIVSAQRDTGTNASNITMVRLVTDDFPQDIMQDGWVADQDMSLAVENGGGWQWLESDVLIIRTVDPVSGSFIHALIGYISKDLSSFLPIYPIYPNRQGIAAHAGGGQADATVLSIGINVVTSAGSNGDSVKLPPDVLDQTCVVINRSGKTLDVYPSEGDEIDVLGVNVAIALSNNLGKIFVGNSALNWASFD